MRGIESGDDRAERLVEVVTQALGGYVADQLLSVKRDEWEAYRAHVSPWELQRYLDA